MFILTKEQIVRMPLPHESVEKKIKPVRFRRLVDDVGETAGHGNGSYEQLHLFSNSKIKNHFNSSSKLK
jgi:hypothetical protein